MQVLGFILGFLLMSKINFVVPVDGTTRRLFSVVERANGELLIATHLAGLYNLEAGLAPIKESRHLVHVSEESSGNLIHTRYVHGDKSHSDRYLLTTAVKTGRFQPICVRSVINPNCLLQLSGDINGSVNELRPYFPSANTMHYAIWLSSPQTEASLPSHAPFQIERIKFDQFCLYIPYCFSKGASPEHGLMMEYCTTSAHRRSETHKALGNRVGPAEGASGPATIGYMVRDFNRIIHTPYGEVGISPDLGPLVPQIANFLRDPVPRGPVP